MFQDDLSILLRVLVACLLSGVLGWERESAGKAAGLRTHILVGVAAVLFTVVGEFNKGMITIVVRNPLPAANLTMRDGNRLALANIKERMDLMYGERATVKAGRFDDEYIVTLRFPFQPVEAARRA